MKSDRALHSSPATTLEGEYGTSVEQPKPMYPASPATTTPDLEAAVRAFENTVAYHAEWSTPFGKAQVEKTRAALLDLCAALQRERDGWQTEADIQAEQNQSLAARLRASEQENNG